jgi:hypothetical protein
VNGAEPRIAIPAARESTGIYFRLGVEHILTGLDHLLFVLCLLLLVRDRKSLFGAVTAFTVAHSLTLAATIYGWIRLASLPVEACIALSIAFVAAEVLKARAGQVTLTQQKPWVAAFGFGLLHGFGFAAALRELGLPDDAVAIALLFFNLGVEAGQLLFVAALLPLLAYVPAPRTAAYAAGIAACFWFIERTARMIHGDL